MWTSIVRRPKLAKSLACFHRVQNSRNTLESVLTSSKKTDYSTLSAAELRRFAQQGDAEAQVELGRALYYGRTVEQDFSEAAIWFERAAFQGHAGAMLRLARLYDNGLGVSRDVGRATEFARQAAMRGNMYAMTLLGWFYEAGTGVEPDLEEAERWYLKGIAAGDPEAYYYLAKLYLNNNQLREGLDCVQRGIDAGSPECHMLLGNMYSDGWGVEQDYKLSLHWLNLAAQMGQADALNNVGLAYRLGLGVVPDHARALKIYLEAAAAGSSVAMFNVGSCYREGIGTKIDEKQAAHWIKKSAQEGYVEAKYHYGILLMEGFGVEQDIRAGIDYVQEAADAGFAEAQYQIGLLFLQGDLIPQDNVAAASWFELAAEQNHAASQYELGVLLFSGEDVEPNYGASIEWLRRALKNELWKADEAFALAVVLSETEDQELIKEAMSWARSALARGQKVEVLIAELFVLQGKRDQAVKWAKVAAERGDPDAQALLGKLLHQSGKKKEAEQWWSAAAKQGHGYALWLLAQLNEQRGDINAAIKLYEQAYENGIAAAHDEAQQLRSSKKARDTGQNHEDDAAQRKMGYSDKHRVHSDVHVGSVVAQTYVLESVLGKGGFAVVFKARHLMMNRTVAIKMLLPEHLNDETSIKRFQREAKACSVLQHPHVVTVFDYGHTESGKPFIVMDYLNGLSLEDLLEKHGKLAPEVAVPILIQVCDGMTEAHEQNVVHRDLKPSNIMLIQAHNNQHFVKIVDFGIAKIVGDDPKQQKVTRTGEVFGSLLYMSPEQCLGQKLDGRSDIYALGCSMFEMFTGQLAFAGATVYETMARQINEPPPRLTEFLPNKKWVVGMERIICKALAKDREDRYQTMSLLQRDLEALV
jgi:uncharacterized protein